MVLVLFGRLGAGSSSRSSGTSSTAEGAFRREEPGALTGVWDRFRFPRVVRGSSSESSMTMGVAATREFGREPEGTALLAAPLLERDGRGGVAAFGGGAGFATG